MIATMSALDGQKTLDRKLFLASFPATASAIRRGAFRWDTLQAIYGDYLRHSRDTLEPFMGSLVAQLGKIDGVHSTKARLKDAEHLIEKIVRRGWSHLTPRSYRRRVGDLVGARVLHLYKSDWAKIHSHISQHWRLKDRPVANVRAGDSDDYISELKERGCVIKRHPFGYRSIHYTIISQPAREEILAEIQVRTIFEEAWSEIDHGIRYPYDADNQLLGRYLVVFNRLAGSADEMGTFIRYLKDEQDEHARRQRQMEHKLKTMAGRIQRLRKGSAKEGKKAETEAGKSILETLEQQLNEGVRLAEDIRALQDAFLGGTNVSSADAV